MSDSHEKNPPQLLLFNVVFIFNLWGLNLCHYPNDKQDNKISTITTYTNNPLTQERLRKHSNILNIFLNNMSLYCTFSKKSEKNMNILYFKCTHLPRIIYQNMAYLLYFWLFCLFVFFYFFFKIRSDRMNFLSNSLKIDNYQLPLLHKCVLFTEYSKF